MGLMRNFGYFIGIIFFLGGLLLIGWSGGISLISSALGLMVIWMLRGQAKDEKKLKELNGYRY
jgi:protein-S-isoprenylcysteine O-methyltransferase Ste14